MLIAPTEPKLLHALGETSSVPEQYGADILVPAPGYLIGVQRKTFPADFLASLYDGRLATSITKLAQCRGRILVLEGRPKFTASGVLANEDRYPSFRLSTLQSIMLDAAINYGVATFWTDDLASTARFLERVSEWVNSTHASLSKRPRERSDYERDTKRDRAAFLLQGFQGIGPSLAYAIYDSFDGVPLHWSVTPQELENVDGLGPKRVNTLLQEVEACPAHS